MNNIHHGRLQRLQSYNAHKMRVYPGYIKGAFRARDVLYMSFLSNE